MQSKTKQKSNWMRRSFIASTLAIPIVSFLVFYIVPNVSAFTMAFQNYRGEWTLDNFRRMFGIFSGSGADLRLALRNTLITFGIGVVSYPFKVLVSYFIYKKIPFFRFYRIVFFIPVVIFSVAFSLVLLQMFAPNGFIAQWVGQAAGLEYAPELLADSRYANWVVLLELVWVGFPGELIIWSGTFTRIPEDVLESGKIDGTTWWSEFTRIIVPMVGPTVGLQMTLMFCGMLSASGEVFLLTGGEHGTITLSSWLYLQVYNNSGSLSSSNALYYMSAVGLSMTVVSIIIARTVRYIADRTFEEVEY